MTDKGFFSKKNSNGKDIRFVKKKYDIEEHREGNRVTKFRVLGKNKMTTTRIIRKEIVDEMKKKRCSVLNTGSNIEVDHKNGRYNDKRVLDTRTQDFDDFQPLSKVVNNIKREVCKKCTHGGGKFNATSLGYLVPTLDGVMVHDETPQGCEGCFYYDVENFKDTYNEVILRMFKTGREFSRNKFYDEYRKLKEV